mmetsp:Transcript_21007/g.21797  ORF Transcript_21007/g.21797 Transcript_21007/m.21797 type:complete len:98 (+) Transcript_21007:812-1105(+)
MTHEVSSLSLETDKEVLRSFLPKLNLIEIEATKKEMIHQEAIDDIRLNIHSHLDLAKDCETKELFDPMKKIIYHHSRLCASKKLIQIVRSTIQNIQH